MEVKKIRLSKLLTQTEFAKEIGVTLSCVQKWEKGIRNPSLKHQRKIIEWCKENGVEICN